ncbi:uncharacterized protein LOC113388633 [Ctenocephalides felis]|uniref:uncharacterized protein LOC113388633 n=1 Tax=Ctenocephalides felis TaxID=7515 RepID=UPI000E6E5B92|nr:uncharacterized protein LOC113388633 [Ctenocephalides felis]
MHHQHRSSNAPSEHDTSLVSSLDVSSHTYFNPQSEFTSSTSEMHHRHRSSNAPSEHDTSLVSSLDVSSDTFKNFQSEDICREPDDSLLTNIAPETNADSIVDSLNVNAIQISNPPITPSSSYQSSGFLSHRTQRSFGSIQATELEDICIYSALRKMIEF